ncbi:group III truncated hemoglobin [Flavobacterium sp.]|uniref:group III truncated hemoglobin n=1 Tax=Flavobacterium sp. TaxID=239 RepID=UPI00261CD551|nr:group III truncated hemoglobin [Flavobacterium sp.]
MHDIKTRDDLLLLMRAFYGRLLADPAISYIFTEIAKIDLEAHLPHLADFWEQTLFYTGGYKKNVLQIHLDLNAKEQLTAQHFEIWLNHFYAATDKNFTGANSERIKTRAASIATVMKIKLSET